MRNPSMPAPTSVSMHVHPNIMPCMPYLSSASASTAAPSSSRVSASPSAGDVVTLPLPFGGPTRGPASPPDSCNSRQ